MPLSSTVTVFVPLSLNRPGYIVFDESADIIYVFAREILTDDEKQAACESLIEFPIELCRHLGRNLCRIEAAEARLE
jgi:hypothetical protein